MFNLRSQTAVFLISFLWFLGGMKNTSAQKFSDSTASIQVTLIDGHFLYGDSIKYLKNRIKLYATVLPSHKIKSRFLDSLEVFKIKEGKRVEVLYDPAPNEWNLFEMESMIHGKQMARKDFKKWKLWAAGFSTGFLTGAYFGSSIPTFVSPFGYSYIYYKMPVFRAKPDRFSNEFERRGYKEEIRNSRFMPFLFANLVGIMVGISQSKTLL